MGLSHYLSLQANTVLMKPQRSVPRWSKVCINLLLLSLVLFLLNTMYPATKAGDTAFLERGSVSNATKAGHNSDTAEYNSPSSLFSSENFDSLGARLARAFPPLKNKHSWCSFEYSRAKPTGLLFVKLPKAASSTLAGIARRIASRHGNGPEHPCMLRDGHITGNRVGEKFSTRDRKTSFLWSAVRNPSSRAMSRVFFSRVSQGGMEPSDENIVDALHLADPQIGAVSEGKGGFQLAYLSLHEIRESSFWSNENRTKVMHPNLVQDLVDRIVEDYDFLVVVERMEESLVAMQLLLGLNTGDILSTASKVGGGYYYTNRGECTKLVRSFSSTAVKEYLSSDEWYAMNYGDFLLHSAANKSLDLTITRLGRDRFYAALSEFRRLKRIEEEVCAPLAIFPCSVEGIPQENISKNNCYSKDWGCGYPCIDKMLLNETRQSTD